MSHVICHVSRVRCHLSHVTPPLSPVTSHLSLPPTATATDPPPDNSTTMHSRLVCKDPKTQKKIKRQKIIEKKKEEKKEKTSRGMPILAISSLTRSLWSTGKWGFKTWTGYLQTDIATYRLGPFSENQ